MKRRFVVWRGTDEWRAEAAALELRADGLRAAGTQIGAGYRIDYELDAGGDGFATRRLTVTVERDGERDQFALGRDAMGGATDCGLALSPLTNAMPILRHRLHERPGAHEFTMAWVDVPSLALVESRQRYEHVAAGKQPRRDAPPHVPRTNNRDVHPEPPARWAWL